MLFRVLIDGFSFITFQLRETRTVVSTIMEVQPKISKEGSTKSSSDIVFELAIVMKNRISKKIDLEKCHRVHLKVYKQMTNTNYLLLLINTCKGNFTYFRKTIIIEFHPLRLF